MSKRRKRKKKAREAFSACCVPSLSQKVSTFLHQQSSSEISTHCNSPQASRLSPLGGQERAGLLSGDAEPEWLEKKQALFNRG